MKYAASKHDVPIYLNSNYYFSLLCLVIQAVLWPVALRSIPLNKAYAVMTLQYPFVFLGGIIFFKYVPNLQELSAMVLIFIGNLVVVYGK
jgi:drug/metabolite transporter (DMT)-like permease